MKIILSPTKTMSGAEISLPCRTMPVFLPETEKIIKYLKSLTAGELKKLWNCSDAIAEQNIKRLESFSLETGISPAILSYEGISFQYMKPSELGAEELDYLQKHLRILSAMYGVLKPLDGIGRYRLEMQSRAGVEGKKDLYNFWGEKLYRELDESGGVIINLASKEYSRCIEKYLRPEDSFISCSFLEEVKGRLSQKATYSKMARGEMIRFLALKKAEYPEKMKNFTALGYRFREDISTESEYIFERVNK